MKRTAIQATDVLTLRVTRAVELCVAVTCALQPACKRHAPADPGPDLQILDESTILRSGDPVPKTSPYFDGTTARLAAITNERVGVLVYHREPAAVRLTSIPDGIATETFAVEPVHVTRASTNLYGGGRGAGDYPDILVADEAPTTNPAYVTIEPTQTAKSGDYTLTLAVGSRSIPVIVHVDQKQWSTSLHPLWAYYDPRELEWAGLGHGTINDPSEQEKACIVSASQYGVRLSPDLPLAAWEKRHELLTGFPYVPVKLDVDHVADDVQGWLRATQGTLVHPFAIPIDEPRKPEARARVKALAEQVRAAAGGPDRFWFAVTDAPRAEYGDLIDLYITLAPKKADTFRRWTYNGAPPRAGNVVVDAVYPGPMSWGWLGWRWRIDLWYVWDAMYWHDRHNRKGAPLPGRALDATKDAVSFNDGEDHGNLDGVLVFPGDEKTPCRPTLRLAKIGRGQLDRVLLDEAARCHRDEVEKIVDGLIPRALGDAPEHGKPAWPSDPARWIEARNNVRQLAVSCP